MKKQQSALANTSYASLYVAIKMFTTMIHSNLGSNARISFGFAFFLMLTETTRSILTFIFLISR